MPEVIPQSVTKRVMLRVFLSSDHVSEATSKTVAVTISKNGAAHGNPSGGATNCTEVSSGLYYVDLTTSDTGTTGPLEVRGTSASCDNAYAQFTVANAHNAGFDALPSTACTTNASLLTSGTSTDQVSVSAGKVLLQATQSGVTIPTVTTVTNQLTAAAIATGVWQDTTSGDFTVSSSIGKSLYTTGNAPGAASGLAIVGSAMGDSSGVTTLLSRISGSITISGGKVAATMGSGDYSGNTVQTGDAYARLGAPAGVSVSADIVAIKSDTSSISTGVSNINTNVNTLIVGVNVTKILSTTPDLSISGRLLVSIASIFDLAGNAEYQTRHTGAGTTVTFASGVVATTTNITAASGVALASTGADLVLVDGKTLPAALQIIAAACCGLISDAGGGTEHYKGLDESTTRFTVTVDASGNRSAVTYG
jgi:hypothetical protein